jgi:hypothetical protein
MEADPVFNEPGKILCNSANVGYFITFAMPGAQLMRFKQIWCCITWTNFVTSYPFHRWEYILKTRMLSDRDAFRKGCFRQGCFQTGMLSDRDAFRKGCFQKGMLSERDAFSQGCFQTGMLSADIADSPQPG